MASAAQADFDRLDASSGANPATQDVPLQIEGAWKILMDFAALWNATRGENDFSVGTDPDTALQYIGFGSTDTKKHAIRVGFDGTNFVVQENTAASDAVPAVWATRLSLAASTGALLIGGGLVMNGALSGLTGLSLVGDLDMGANDILNVGNVAGSTFAGMDPTSHAARHLVSGADALSVGTPVAVGSANAEGSASNLARRDHIHEAIHEIDVDGAGNLHGDVDLLSGNVVELTRSGNNVTFDEREAKLKKKTTANQSVNPGSGSQVLVQFDGANDFLDLGALADGSREIALEVFLPVQIASANQTLIRVYVGANGTDADTLFFQYPWNPSDNDEDSPIHINGLLLRDPSTDAPPSADDRVSIYVRGDGASPNITVEGSGTTNTRYGWLLARAVNV